MPAARPVRCSAAVRLQLQGKEQASKRAQTALRASVVRRWDSATWTPAGNCSTRVKMAVKPMIRLEFSLLPHASLPAHQTPRGHRRGRGRVRARASTSSPAKPAPASPSWSKPSACCSAAARPATWSGPAKTPRPSRRSSRAATARADRPARNHRAGPQPRLRQRRARDRRRAARICLAALDRAPRPARASGPARSRHTSRRARRVRPARADARATVARAFDAMRDVARRAGAAAMDARGARRAAWTWSRSSSARSRRASRRPGEDEELGADAPGAGQRRAGRAPVRRKLRGALRERRRGARRARRRLEAGRRSSRRSIRSSQPYLEARDGIKSQLEDLALLPARLRRRHRRLAGAAAAGRGSARAARAAEAEVRPDAGRRDRASATRCARELAELDARRRAARGARARS